MLYNAGECVTNLKSAPASKLIEVRNAKHEVCSFLEKPGRQINSYNTVRSTMKYHFTPTRVVIIKKTDNSKC